MVLIFLPVWQFRQYQFFKNLLNFQGHNPEVKIMQKCIIDWRKKVQKENKHPPAMFECLLSKSFWLVSSKQP